MNIIGGRPDEVISFQKASKSGHTMSGSRAPNSQSLASVIDFSLIGIGSEERSDLVVSFSKIVRLALRRAVNMFVR